MDVDKAAEEREAGARGLAATWNAYPYCIQTLHLLRSVRLTRTSPRLGLLDTDTRLVSCCRFSAGSAAISDLP